MNPPDLFGLQRAIDAIAAQKAAQEASDRDALQVLASGSTAPLPHPLTLNVRGTPTRVATFGDFARLCLATGCSIEPPPEDRGVWGDILDGAKTFAKAAKIVAPIAGMIPGVGTAISVGLTAAAALANGDSLADAAIDLAASAVPGGGVAQEAFSVGLHAAKGLAEGRALDDVALDAARRELGAHGGEAAVTAFDTGIALAHGQNLADAGFAAASAWLPGDGPTQQALGFTQKMIAGARAGRSAVDVALDEVRDQVAALPVTDQVKLDDVTAAIEAAPSLATLGAPEVARRLRVPVAVARATIAATPNGQIDTMRLLQVSPASLLQVKVSSPELVNRIAEQEAAAFAGGFAKKAAHLDTARLARSSTDAASSPTISPRNSAKADAALAVVVAGAVGALWLWSRDHR